MNGNDASQPRSNVKRTLFGMKRPGLYPLLPLLLLALATGITVLLFPRQSNFRFAEFSLGSISRVEVLAPFTFEVMKSEQQLAQERDAASSQVEPVFVRSDSIRREQLQRLRGTFRAVDRSRDALRSMARANDPALLDRRRELLDEARSTYNLKLNDAAWNFLLGDIRSRRIPQPVITGELIEPILRDIYGRGVLDRSREEVAAPRGQIRLISEGEERTLAITAVYDLALGRKEALTRLSSTLESGTDPSDSTLKVAYELLISFLSPNLTYDELDTRARKEAAIAKVPIADGIVLKDERIIDSNERVTQIHLDKLRSLEIKRAELAREDSGWNRILPWIGRVLLAGLVFTFFGYWLYRFRPDIYRKPNRLLLFWVMLMLMIVLYGTIFAEDQVNFYLFPAALGTVILAIVFIQAFIVRSLFQMAARLG